MITERKISWHPKIRSITQIPNEGLEYAWVSENYEQIHQLIWCKDFMQDIIHSWMTHQPISNLYNFHYDPGKCPYVYMKKSRMIIVNRKDHAFGSKVLDNLMPFLHKIEDRLKMQHSVVEKCLDVPRNYAKSGVYLIESDSRWLIAPPMVSLLTLLLRVGMLHDANKSVTHTIRSLRNKTLEPYYQERSKYSDDAILRKCSHSIKRIFREGDEAIFGTERHKNYPPEANIGAVHNSYGLWGWSVGESDYRFPEWREGLTHDIRN